MGTVTEEAKQEQGGGRGTLVAQIVAVLFFRLLLNTGRRFVYPFAPALSRSFAVELTAITSILATCQTVSLLGLFSGPLADRFGYRTMMRGGLGLLAGGMLLCATATGFWWLAVGLVVASLGKIVFDPAIQAFIGKHVPFERRGRVIGLVETAWAGSTLVAIPALGVVIERFGMTSAFWLLALLGFVGWLLVGRVFARDDGGGEAGRRPALFAALPRLVAHRPALGMLLFGFFVSLANDGLFVVYGAWFEQAFNTGVATLGFSAMAIGTAELLGEAATILLVDRLGAKRAMVLGLCLAMGAYLLLPLIGRSLPLAMAGLFLVFFCFEFTIVASFALSTELLPEARATMMAGFYAIAGVGRMVGVLLGGGLWQMGGIAAVAGSAAVLTGCGLLALLWGLHRWRRPSLS
jgi:predicted MFS family arabinose efflux permease